MRPSTLSSRWRPSATRVTSTVEGLEGSNHDFYRFRHALLRDEAYESLVRSERRAHHLRIGVALETDFQAEAAARPEIVAQHFLQGGDANKGVFYLLMAPRRAVGVSANIEATRHAERALAVLSEQPASAARARLELACHTLRGSALLASRGYAADQVQDAFARARELVSEAGESPQLVPVLHGLWLFHMVRGDREPSAELAEQLRVIGESSEDEASQLFGLTAAGIQAFFTGRFAESVDLVERAYALYEPARHRQLAVTYSLGTAGVARANAAFCLWALGYPDRAAQLARQVIEAARRDRHPFTLAGVLTMASMVFQVRGDALLFDLGTEALEIATQQSFPLWVGGGLVSLGRGITARGEPEAGIARSQEGLERFRATGAQLDTSFVLGGLTEMLLAQGRLEEAEAAIHEALDICTNGLEVFYASEIVRLEGEVVLAQSGDESEARRHFERAYAMTCDGRAPSLALRAAMSLVRLALRGGPAQEELTVLGRLYASFTEGFDTQDLREARALLGEKAGP